jgi:Protein of unknown function (DUF3025)
VPDESWPSLRVPPSVPAFDSVRRAWLSLADATEWPTAADLNAAIGHCSRPAAVRFIDAEAVASHEHYEERIVSRSEVVTRRNAHDLFNALIWMTFPKAKRALSERHVSELAKGGLAERRRRGPVRDALTLFDESGAFVLSTDGNHLAALRLGQWDAFFGVDPAIWRTTTRVWVFGHAALDQLRHPFIGLTCRALPLLVSPDELRLDDPSLADWLDTRLAALLATEPLHPRQTFCPLPILGVPGWYAGNAEASFYNNTAYFRRQRHRA